jgi:uncharacterized membrane protein YkgB
MVIALYHLWREDRCHDLGAETNLMTRQRQRPCGILRRESALTLMVHDNGDGRGAWLNCPRTFPTVMMRTPRLRLRGKATDDDADLGRRIGDTGTVMLRYGLVLILLTIGGTKWTAAEAEAIRPWVANSPFLSWMYSIASTHVASELIGIIEVVAALMIALRHWLPRATVVGSALAAGMFVVTLSFLVTTPNQSPDAQGFLMKDFFLLGAAIVSTGEALEASTRSRGQT